MTPSAPHEQRERWDLLVLDIGTRTKQIRRPKSHKPRRLLIWAVMIGAALVGAGAAVAALHYWLPGHPGPHAESAWNSG